MCSRLVVTMPMMTSVQCDRQTPWEVQYLVANPLMCSAVTVVGLHTAHVYKLSFTIQCSLM